MRMRRRTSSFRGRRPTRRVFNRRGSAGRRRRSFGGGSGRQRIGFRM